MKNRASKLFGCVMTVVLAVSLMPLTAFAAGDHAPAADGGTWADEIDAMLASGDYLEGEVVVGFWENGYSSGLSAQAAPYAVEKLMEVDGTAVDGQEKTAKSGSALNSQSVDADRSVQISLVTSSSLSTEQLLSQLADDPNVAFAEPNYQGEFTANNEGDLAAVTTELLAQGVTTQATDNTVSDLTQLQWGNSSKGAHFDGAGNTSINVPGFAKQDKASNMKNQVVVAVMDLAVDATNPDLAPTLMQFSDKQQKELGCGKWGYNATAESTDGVMDVPTAASSHHGTHVAGIIGAQWDGSGTSGVASNAKIVFVQNGGENGKTSLGNNLRGYAFIKKYNDSVKEAKRVKAVNNSWGLMQSSRALNAAVTEIGEKHGVVSVFAAGNDTRDNNTSEYLICTLADNPYAIIVAATDSSGTLTSYSQWGDRNVHLAAPGETILSTCSIAHAQYIPDASLDTNICYEGFEGTSQPNVWLVDRDGNKLHQATLDKNVRLNGKQGAALKLENGVKGDNGQTGYYVQVELPLNGDIKTKIKAAENLYIGVGAEVSKASNFCYTISMTSNVFEGRVNAGSLNQAGFDGGNWGVFTIMKDSITQTSFRDMLDEDRLASADKLVVTLAVLVKEPCETLHIDSIGIGTQKVPYAFSSGTSQAAPAVTGAAAVLASQTGKTGAALASLVRSKVRIPESGKLPVRTGGVFDFSVKGSSAKPLAPAISKVKVDGKTVTVTGKNFGASKGKVKLARYVIGKDDATVQSSVSSWTGKKVVLKLKSNFKGILRVELTNTDGKHDIAYLFVSKRKSNYEYDLPFDADAGKSFKVDGVGDLETEGPLLGLNGKLYYLPTVQPVELVPVTKRLMCFDLATEKWTQLKSLPVYLQGVSAVVNNGKIIVEGATTYKLASGEPTDVFPEGKSAKERVYVYDPAKNSWSTASTKGVHIGQSLVNDGGKLKLVGGQDESTAYIDDQGQYIPGNPYPFTSYSLKTGAGKAFSTPTVAFMNPQVAAVGGVLYLYDPSNIRFMRVKDGKATELTSALPEFLLSKDDEIEVALMALGGKASDPCVGWASLVAVKGGVALVGLPAKNGASDTFILKNGKNKFEAYKKRASDARVFSTATCAYDGRLFVIGASPFEPDGRLFRATLMATPKNSADKTHVHVWDAGKVTKKATAYKKGTRTYICEICGKTKKEGIPTTVTKGKTYKVSCSTYKVTSNTAKKRTVTLTKAKNAKSFTVPATVKIKGATYKVTGLGTKAFSKAKKVRIVIVKSKALKKASVKNCFKCSKVITVKVKVGTKAQNKKHIGKYKKIFTKVNCGKNVTVK